MTSCVHKMCRRTYGQTNIKRALTLAKINHPWNLYNMRMLRSWPTKIPNMNKMRQKTSCVHKMCEWTYGQTNMKRALTLAKINHPWNRYNMHMLRSWPTKIPNMNKMRQKDKWLVAYTRCADGLMVKQTWKGLNSRKNQPSVKSV
jgi:ribosome-binding ATPase YchF (GTP1/OBG family)